MQTFKTAEAFYITLLFSVKLHQISGSKVRNAGTMQYEKSTRVMVLGSEPLKREYSLTCPTVL
jgi:hypothetical protein